ncbi:MAG TPA: hypothetical protein DDW17_05065, partial [Deltaproteobacteria bacterium]|nr:hypothetical protein [Deltaproteobacteria bacterium]
STKGIIAQTFNTCGYDCKPFDNGIEVFISANGYQEFKMLVEEVLSIANSAGARFLGYVG